MRILHVIPSVGPVRGGPSQAVLELARAQARMTGMHTEIVATNDNGPGLLDVPIGEVTQYEGAPVRFFPRHSPRLRPLREFAYSGALSAWLGRHMHEYDLIHVHAFFSHASTAAMCHARRLHKPYLVRPLGLLCTWSLEQSALRKSLYLALVERKNLDHAAGLEYTSEQELDEAAPLHLKAPGFVLPFGLHLQAPVHDARPRLRTEMGLPPDEPVLLFLSRLHPKKGLHHLLEALATRVARRFTLIVAGSGPQEYEDQVRAMVHNGPLRDRVKFTGFASGENKNLLLQGADAFTLTSHSESFAIAAMEAMAAGTPVLLTPGVPLATAVARHDTGWVCDLTTDSIARAVDTLLDGLTDAEAVAARARRCRALAVNFEWNRIAASMQEVYKAVLARREIPSMRIEDLLLQYPE